jgi:hypothetical protein
MEKPKNILLEAAKDVVLDYLIEEEETALGRVADATTKDAADMRRAVRSASLYATAIKIVKRL